jgi:hypothetical protein
MKKVLKGILYLYLLVLLLFAGFIVYTALHNYHPDEKWAVYYSENPDLLSDTSMITILTWNTGYFGEDAATDHHTQLKSNPGTRKMKTSSNMEGIKKVLINDQNIDIILLQDVDLNSERSGNLNGYQYINNLFPDRISAFAINYNVPFIPTPVLNPVGKVKAGLMTVSKYNPSVSIRYAYPKNKEFPQNVFDYDRCFLVNRYKISNEKELILVNLHNSDIADGILKKSENEYLFKFLKSEYDKENYIIVGGDWNQTPTSYKPVFQKDKVDKMNVKNLDIKELKDWKCIYDASAPTVRSTTESYKKGVTLTSINDFYLISPNLQFVFIRTLKLDFKNASHEPVKICLKFKS